MVADAWEVARRGAEWGITGDVHLTFPIKEHNATGAKFDARKQLILTKEDSAAVCKIALTILAERLKDMDAELMAFRCGASQGRSGADGEGEMNGARAARWQSFWNAFPIASDRAGIRRPSWTPLASERGPAWSRDHAGSISVIALRGGARP